LGAASFFCFSSLRALLGLARRAQRLFLVNAVVREAKGRCSVTLALDVLVTFSNCFASTRRPTGALAGIDSQRTT